MSLSAQAVASCPSRVACAPREAGGQALYAGDEMLVLKRSSFASPNPFVYFLAYCLMEHSIFTPTLCIISSIKGTIIFFFLLKTGKPNFKILSDDAFITF